MELLSSRLSTFSLTRKKPAHGAWPYSPSTHPRLTPILLAEAGWYYTPTKDDPDLVTCFLCGKEVGGWAEEDDPFEEHVGHQKGKCGWARTKCEVERQKRVGGQGEGEVLRARFNDASELPQSKQLESARLSTFGKWWPHDKKKAWLPTSKNLAKAGFIFSPNAKGSDMASCLYCELGLDGWSPTDDPFHEHQVRTPKCPFFIATVGGAVSSSAAANKAQAVEDDEDDFEIIEAPVKTPATKAKKAAAEKAPSTAATTKSTASTKARSTRAGKEAEPAPSTSAAPTPASTAPTTSRHTRTGSTTSQISTLGRSTRGPPAPEPEADDEDDEPVVEEAPLGRSTRGKPAPAAAPAPKRAARGKKAVAEEEEAVEDEPLEDVAEEEMAEEDEKEEKPVAKGKGKAKAAPKAKKAPAVAKATKGKGKKAVLVEEEEQEQEDEPAEEDDEMKDVEPPAPKSAPSSRPSSSSAGKPLPKLPSSATSSLTKPPSTSSRPPTTSKSKPTATVTSSLTKIATSSSSRIPTPIKSPLAKLPQPQQPKTPSGLPRHLLPTGTPSASMTSQEFADARAAAVVSGAQSAERVVQNWALSFSPAAAAAGPSSLSKAAGVPLPGSPAPANSKGAASISALTDPRTEAEGVSLTAEQGSILVEEWVRMEYRLRHEELRRLGEDEEIGRFKRAAEQARRRLVEEIEVEEEDEE